MMVDFALTYGMKNNDLLKEILTHDDLHKQIHQNLFLNLFRGFPRRHELIDSKMFGYQIVYPKDPHALMLQITSSNGIIIGYLRMYNS